MKKTLLLTAMCSIATLSFAQQEVVKNEIVDVPEVNIVEEYVDMVEAEAVETTNEIYIKRPGGVFHPGLQQKSGAKLTAAYVKAPAYVPLTWSIGKDHFSDNNETGGAFSLAVPTANSENDAEQTWLNTEGEDITSMFYPMGSKFYTSPVATCVNAAGEYAYTLFPPYIKDATINPAHIYAGGSLSSSSTSGYQMAANYNAYWAGTSSYSSKYYGFNNPTSDAGWVSKGYEKAHVLGLCETFDKPASPYVLMSASWHLYLPSGSSAGALKFTVRKMTGNTIGEILAVSYADEPVYVNGTTVIYNFTELLDKDDKKMDYLIVEDQIMVEISLLDDDTETGLIGAYTSSPTYNGEAHAYTHISYEKDGAPAEAWANSNYKWTSNGVGYYQQAFRCGLEVKYYYAKVIDRETGKATEKNEVSIPTEGNVAAPADLYFDSFLNYGGWKIVTADGDEFTRDGYDWTCDKYGWLKISTVPETDEAGAWNGYITMNISADANAGDEETVNLVVDCRGFKEPITIKRAGNATGIANVGLVKAANNVTYNLQGQRVNAQAKGIVVRNGAKFVNK